MYALLARYQLLVVSHHSVFPRLFGAVNASPGSMSILRRNLHVPAICDPLPRILAHRLYHVKETGWMNEPKIASSVKSSL
ncbi:unnamed protein product [Periconia digitata]|uniref:Uncharacterized protein n=1 Tax=Periconia digitata TaxID=1303443 RepID=A0A9W4UFW3_9PLEO|nr:unnamed protein product [Periconia digitata]